MMGANNRQLNALLITANVGSIFEDPEQTLQQWLSQFLELVQATRPEFIAIHCQEVGGKNYEESMQHVDHFVKTMMAAPALTEYSRTKVYLDEDFTATDKFTALGNLYFVHDAVENVQIWNFEKNLYEDVSGTEIVSGNIEHVETKEKMKFPVHYFPDCKWSRKGFLRTRWSINRLKFDLYNIHLFHDASNLAALERSPSQYCEHRQRAFKFVLDRARNESLEKLPHFIFGDFNFRLDSHKLINKLKEANNLAEHQIRNQKNGKVSRVQYKSQDSEEVVLTIELKAFEHHKHEDVFLERNVMNVLEFDTEAEAFKHELYEFPIEFPPSYPYTEDVDDGSRYMRTRCPSWCDRILMNRLAKEIVNIDDVSQPRYDTVGQNVCMGDHKPVYLQCRLHLPIEKRPIGKSISAQGNFTSSLCQPVHAGVPPVVPSSPLHKKARRAISINGVTVPETDLKSMSLIRNASFSHEEHLTHDMRRSIGKDFSSVAHTIDITGKALKKWKKKIYRFSDDDESGSDHDGSSDINGNVSQETGQIGLIVNAMSQQKEGSSA